MRMMSVVVPVLVLVAATAAQGQSVVVHGSAGPTLVDRGVSVAGGVGVSPWSRVTLSLNVDRTHLPMRVTTDGRGGRAATRGGTMTLGAAELLLALFPPHRVTPYVIAGYALGRSKPNVNPTFPDPVTNSVYALVGGGGVQVPLGRGLAVFADARMIFGGEATEVVAVAPLRAGLRWRF